MMISTRGRYALRVMVSLSRHDQSAYTPLKEIAEVEEISLKYLESIMAALSKAGLVEGAHGKGGGCPKITRCATYPVWHKLDRLINGFLDSVSLSELMTAEPGNNYII